MGIISHIVLKISKNYKLDKTYLICNLSFIGILGHSNWLINIVNLSFNLNLEILALIFRISIAVVIFLLLVNWCFILYKSKIQLETTVLFAIRYIITMFLSLCILFLLSLTNVKIEMVFYFIVVNIVFFALFAGFYLCFSKIFGFYYSEFLGVLQFWFFFIGSNLSFFPYFCINIIKFHNRTSNSSWEEFIAILNTASEFGFYFLIVSFLLFITVLIEGLIKKRNNKDLILNLSKFYIKNATSKLDFLIAICFLIYFLFFFVLFIINQVYWVLIAYGGLFLTGVVLSMSPRVTHYFSPLKETSSQLKTSNLIILYKILSPIFVISLIFEMLIKLYQLWLFSLAEHPSKPINGKIPAKIFKKEFSTLATAGGKIVLTKLPQAGYPVMGPRTTLFAMAGMIIIGVGATIKVFYVDFPDRMYFWRYVTHTPIQNLYFWWDYGYIIPHDVTYERHWLIEAAIGRENLVREVHKQLEENQTTTLTLTMLNNIVIDPKYLNDFLQLRPDQMYKINFYPIQRQYIAPAYNGVSYILTLPLKPFKPLKSWLFPPKPVSSKYF